MAHSKCIAFYLLFNSFSKRMCQNFEFISIWFSIIYFVLEMSVRLDSLEPVHFVELFSTSHISKTDVCVVFHFSLLRASTRGYLLLCVSCARNICFIRGVKKKKTQFARLSPEQITRVKTFPPNGNRILLRIYENYCFPSADFKYSSELHIFVQLLRKRTFGQ